MIAMITKIEIEDRIDNLKKGLSSLLVKQDQIKSDIQTTDGAIQDCEYWLSVIKGKGKCLLNESVTDATVKVVNVNGAKQAPV